MVKKLNKVSERLVDDLCLCAKSWGINEEWGNGPSVTASEKQYLNSKAALEKRLLYLETQLIKHRRISKLLKETE